jgi:hypothetical protein
MPLGKSQEMLLHEILHACTYPALTAEKKKYTDEEFVETVAPLLLQVIKQNPQLLVYLMQEEEVAI